MSTRTPAQVTTRLPALPIDRYRGIAAVLLIGMLLVAAFAPQAGTTAAAPPPPLPPFDGQPAPTLADSIFDYPAAAERESILPAPKSAVLRAAPGSADALSAIGGAMIIEDTDPEGDKQSDGSPHLASESVQPGGPSRWDSMEQYFVTIRDAWSANGLAVVETLRAASSEGHDQEVHLRKALYWVDIAVQQGRVQAPYMYNQALLHLALGHYQQAAASMDEVITNPSLAPESGSTFDMTGAQFYKGVALLRLGNPADALTIWRAADAGTPTAWSPAIREGIADALAAQGDATGALAAYQDIQDGSGGVEWGLYEKQLRLTFLQGGAPQALALVRHLADRVPAEPRLQYDLGRLLLLQGQSGGAAAAFRAALQTAPDDPAYHTGLAQALLAGGDAGGAVTESEAAIRAVGLDPAQADLSLTYGKLTNGSAYQRSVGQMALNANVVRMQALARQGQTARVRQLAAGTEAQGAGKDAAQAAWFRYYAGLLYAAGGLTADAQARLQPANTVPGGPPAGALLLGWVRTLTPETAAAAVAPITQAMAGAGGTLPLPPDQATATAYNALARLLESGAAPQAAPFYRAAAAWEAAQAATAHLPSLAANGTQAPVQFRMAEADYLRRQGSPDSLAAARYQQVTQVAPETAAAHTNQGLVLAAAGDLARAQQAFETGLQVDPSSLAAAHDLVVAALNQGLGGIPTVLGALATARVAGGPAAFRWGAGLIPAPDPLGAPVTAPVDFGTRLPAIMALLLLLLHTLIFAPRQIAVPAEGAAPPPSGSILSALALRLQAQLPALSVRPWRLGWVLLIAAVAGGLGWGWALAGNQPLLALAFWPLTFVAALLALAVQEAAQRFVVRREPHPGQVQTRLWPLGLILSIVGAPLGLIYGRLVTTYAHAAPGHPLAAEHIDGADTAPERLVTVAAPVGGTGRGRRGTTATVRRTATPVAPRTRTAAASPAWLPWRGWDALGPAARVALAGLLAPAVLAVLLAVIYVLVGTAVWRVLLIGATSVLAFSAVADRDATGWAVWRRSPLLWLFLFTGAAAALTLLLLGAW